MKRLLYTVSILLLLVSAYFVYQWLVADPNNREPLPTLLTLSSSVITAIIAWKTNGVQVKRVNENSIVDIDQKDDTDITVTDIKGDSTILINKGKESLKN